ncbi:MAG: hypothetical protein AB1792_07165 [Candidatus Zixiibacteriota bacterium]
MTIAACYVSSEGVVLGSDSTTTFPVPATLPDGTSGYRSEHYDSAQKLFELGDDSTAGVLVWGLGGLGDLSFRSLFVRVESEARSKKLSTLQEVAGLVSAEFWAEYTARFQEVIDYLKEPAASDDVAKEKKDILDTLSGGFCIGGRWDRASAKPEAWFVEYAPLPAVAPVPVELTVGQFRLWGWENLVQRLNWGIDENLYQDILRSGKWSGTEEELFGLVKQYAIYCP